MQLSPERRQSAGYMVNLAARLFTRGIEAALAPHGLYYGYMPIFFALADGRAMTQRDLARAAVVEQPTMAATLSRMERDGLITRTPNPDDRRSALVALSEAGRSKLAAVNASAAAVNAMGTGGLSAEERAQFLALLDKVVQELDHRLG